MGDRGYMIIHFYCKVTNREASLKKTNILKLSMLGEAEILGVGRTVFGRCKSFQLCFIVSYLLLLQRIKEKI